ncbi:bifunctional homocysteine S-methyltransferase/methylenetetrahydrofolate reductase [Shouchella lehensis]|uniref:Bifunctional homocysteine S-methyltransferase/methylenetetrahydrofolate reductase n=1 Tax=Shouchella lehensis TaxID=300825 RepID=A0A4Y7WPL6_9BACI|nr:bifunctional homocysteine S-methyltransferase/methylenetetrahydrofolate reductase [Shouchella lehensis]TES50513.1 bifunctional homocysteine S-methyltransferase/methylenetetrahydrofolate reductase [Shouchella lehensis]
MSRLDLKKLLTSSVTVADGAIGTLLYEAGYDLCFEELNVTKPEEIYAIHQAYIEAGATIIQTNSYAANAQKLKRYGLQESVGAINQASVQLARKAVQDSGKKQVFVLGTVGGIQGFQSEQLDHKESMQALVEQVDLLLQAEVDGLLFETFYDFSEIKQLVIESRKRTQLPIIANVSLGDIGVLKGGIRLSDALTELYEVGADVTGLNCRMGPYHMLRSIEELELPYDIPLACYPNASLPGYRDGRFVYASNTDYFTSMSERFINEGVHLIGGCCGTTPAHIKAIKEAASGRKPVKRKIRLQSLKTETIERFHEQRPSIKDLVEEKQTIIVELDPPKKLHIDPFIEGAKAIRDAGADALTLADNSLASPRIDNQTLAMLLKEEGIRSLVHLTCRDRNLIGLQSHLMGLDLAELNDLLVITGDPSKIGDFPGATSVYDVSSTKLLPLIKQMNEGISFSGKSLGRATNFTTAAAFNPNVKHLDKAVRRLEKKIEAGAHYFLTQPIFDEKQFEEVYEATKHLSVPIFVGIMPLTSSRNAEFLHNEVPGISLSDDTRVRMARAGEDKVKAEQEGLAMAKSLADAAATYFNGLYLITPFLRYRLTVELTRYLRTHTTAPLSKERKLQ